MVALPQHCLKHPWTLLKSAHAWKHWPCCLPAPPTILQAVCNFNSFTLFVKPLLWLKRQPVPSHQKLLEEAEVRGRGRMWENTLAGKKRQGLGCNVQGKTAKECLRSYSKVLKAQEKDVSGVRWVPHNGALAVCATAGDINGGFVLLWWLQDEKK